MLWTKLGITALMQLVFGWLLGLMLIPVFRRFKTGKYEPYIGDRFSTDGSEPAFGGVNGFFVFSFGAVMAAVFCENSAKLIAAVIFVGVITFSGVADDIRLDVRGEITAVKTSLKLAYTYAACLTYMLVAWKMGWTGGIVLLPFGAGMADFGRSWCPIAAAVMTAVIYSFRIMNRFGTDETTCIGGLNAVTAFAACIGISVIGSAAKSDELTALGMVSAAAAMSMTVWGLSPSKQRSGSSGGFFTGALVAAGIAFANHFELALIFTALAAVTDSFCAAVQYVIYRRTKKLWLKGSSLHSHLKARKLTDYTVIMIFAAITLVGAGLGIWLTFYGVDKY